LFLAARAVNAGGVATPSPQRDVASSANGSNFSLRHVFYSKQEY
jgi:hypothetical protein